MLANHLPLPLSYRAETVRPLLASLRAGECCSIIGVSGTGKSNLARFLQRHDVQQTYCKDELTWVIGIDSNRLIFDELKPEYVAAALMLERVINEAENRNCSSEFLTWAFDIRKHLDGNPGSHLALQALQDMCERLCEKEHLQLVFLFDQFDDLWQKLDARFFLSLRSMRDQFKYQVVYLVMTRDRLQRMRPDTSEVESFWELFTSHTYGLKPYTEKDAMVMLDRLAARAQANLGSSAAEMVKLSGGHSGLLRAIFWATYDAARELPGQDELLRIAAISEECRKVWIALSLEEQVLCRIIAGKLHLYAPDQAILDELRLKGIVNDNQASLFSPVFATYVRMKTEGNVSGIIVDIPLRQVRLDGQPLQQSLTPLEFKLIEYLALHSGMVCKREDLIQALYGEESIDRNDQRLDAILARLRRALGESAHSPHYLITHRGGGIQLVHGGVVQAVS
jgi:DNA-binding winged helix-turn-helix (wHTH) protein